MTILEKYFKISNNNNHEIDVDSINFKENDDIIILSNFAYELIFSFINRHELTIIY